MTKPKIFIVYYSTYTHVYQLALSIKKGLEAAGAEAHIYQVPEILSKEVLEKMHAPPKPTDVPVITASDLEQADAFMFGFPTRYGTAPAQFKAFWDSTGGLWSGQKLAGKMASIFTSTSTQHGGLETTALTFLPNLIHHGMIYVPVGYSNPLVFEGEELFGGSQYGAGTLTTPTGTRPISKKELEFAEHHGSHFAKVVTQYVNGKK